MHKSQASYHESPAASHAFSLETTSPRLAPLLKSTETSAGDVMFVQN